MFQPSGLPLLVLNTNSSCFSASHKTRKKRNPVGMPEGEADRSRTFEQAGEFEVSRCGGQLGQIVTPANDDVATVWSMAVVAEIFAFKLKFDAHACHWPGPMRPLA